MSDINKPDALTDQTLWILIDLVDELSEINKQLNRVGLSFDDGEIDFGGFEQAMLQLRDCHELLQEVLDARNSAALPL